MSATYHAIGHAYGHSLKSVLVARVDGDVTSHVRTVTGRQSFDELLSEAIAGLSLHVVGKADDSCPWYYGAHNKRVAWKLASILDSQLSEKNS